MLFSLYKFLQRVTQSIQLRKSTKPCALCYKINHENSFENKYSMSNHFDVLALVCQKIDYTMNSIFGNQNKNGEIILLSATGISFCLARQIM